MELSRIIAGLHRQEAQAVDKVLINAKSPFCGPMPIRIDELALVQRACDLDARRL